MESTLKRILAMSEKHDVRMLIVLDGQNWWGYRSDLWNWKNACNRTLSFRQCRFVSVYNWEDIRDKPAALEGLRCALSRETKEMEHDNADTI